MISIFRMPLIGLACLPDKRPQTSISMDQAIH